MKYKFIDICSKIGSGATPRGGKEAYCAEGITLIRSQNVLDFKMSYDGLVYINDEQAKKLNNVEVQKGDILLNITGDSVARCCIVNCDLLPARVNQHVAIIRGKNNFVLNNYLLYFLQYNKKYLLQLASSGATRNALTKNMIENLEIDLPALEEQQKITSILSALDEKIEVNQKINENLEQQAQLLFLDTFIKNISSEWKNGNVSDLGTVVGGATPSKAKSEYYTENGIAWITPKDLSLDKSKFISKGQIDITEIGFKSCSVKIMPKGTVLFSSRAPIGYIAISSNEVTTNQGFKSIIPHEHIGTPYVYFFLKHNLNLIENMASGSTFKEISGSIMKNIPAIIPDEESLSKFNDFCNPIFKKQEDLEHENSILSKIRDTLLPKLMNGEIDVGGVEL